MNSGFASSGKAAGLPATNGDPLGTFMIRARASGPCTGRQSGVHRFWLCRFRNANLTCLHCPNVRRRRKSRLHHEYSHIL